MCTYISCWLFVSFRMTTPTLRLSKAAVVEGEVKRDIKRERRWRWQNISPGALQAKARERWRNREAHFRYPSFSPLIWMLALAPPMAGNLGAWIEEVRQWLVGQSVSRSVSWRAASTDSSNQPIWRSRARRLWSDMQPASQPRKCWRVAVPRLSELVICKQVLSAWCGVWPAALKVSASGIAITVKMYTSRHWHQA